MTTYKLISFRTLKGICMDWFPKTWGKNGKTLSASGYRDTCVNTDKNCTAKNCPIWKKLKDPQKEFEKGVELGKFLGR